MCVCVCVCVYVCVASLGSRCSNQATDPSVSGDQILELERGRFGVHVPVHILQDLAEDRGLGLNTQEYEGIVNSLKVLNHFCFRDTVCLLVAPFIKG